LPAQLIGKTLIKVFVVSALAVAFLSPAAHAQVPLDPTIITHFQTPLWVASAAVPLMTQATPPSPFPGDYYEVAERQTTQQILPAGFPSTTIWAYGPKDKPVTQVYFHYPSLPIAGKVGTTVRVNWINDLKDSSGRFIPHPLQIQQDSHWANPTGLCLGRTTPPDCAGSPKGQYYGPVPTVVHLHGAKTESDSDGIPEAWNLPAGGGAVATYSRGSDWDQTHLAPVPPRVDGAAVFDYANNDAPRLLFFHDHTLGITAQNVYMGLVGGYILQGRPGVDDLDPSKVPSRLNVDDIPLVIQDKSFNVDGSFLFTSEGNTIVVNGNTWPYLNVEPRKYRLRIVSGTDERYLLLNFTNGLKFTQIGNDGGFLPNPIKVGTLSLTSGERADTIVDFSKSAGQNVILQTDRTDVMKFIVASSIPPSSPPDTTPDPMTLALPHQDTICQQYPADCASITVRNVGAFDHTLGKVTGSGLTATGTSMLWDDASTENPGVGTTEEWDVYNFSGDSHPIHLHSVTYEVIDRVNMTTGVHKNPAPGEAGSKDTANVNGHQILRLRVHFLIGGLFAWHCHIIKHEDEEMMRPLCVVDPAHPCNTK
jgi:spore coat protein A